MTIALPVETGTSQRLDSPRLPPTAASFSTRNILFAHAMAEDSDNSSAAPTSRLLVWPRRRRRPRDDTGFVLGWKQTTLIPSASSSCSSFRETVVCASILPPTESLRTYRKRVTKLRQFALDCKPKRCSCLTQSLDIVAVWTASPRTAVHPQDGDDDSSLDIITQQRRGYPWWKSDGESDADNPSHKQLVFYDPPGTGKKQAYSHFDSEYGKESPGNEWSLLIHQLNHSHEISQCLQTGTLPEQALGSAIQDTTMATNATTESPDANKSFWDRVRSFIIRNSMTLLHFQQLYQRKDHSGVLYWFSFLSIVRVLLRIPSDPSEEQRTHICRNCGQVSVFAMKSKSAQRYVAAWNHYLEVTIDFSLGVGAALLLFMAWRYSNPRFNLWTVYANGRRWSIRSLMDAIAWLERFPAGFKLNESLTHNMGHEIRNLVKLQQQLLESTLWNVGLGQRYFLALLFTISGACGWNALLVVLMDLWRLETLHLWVLTTCFRYMYRIELFLLSALFRLFRGKKRNILRQRTDSMQYDAMQLLVGTICFCICIFLWMTMVIYYVFFVISNWVFNLPVVFLWILYAACRAIPCGSLGWRLWKPQWFSKSVYLESMSADDQEVRVAKLCSVAESPERLLVSKVSIHISSLIRWLLSSLFEAIVPRTSNKTPCSMPFTSLMANFGRESDQ